MNKMDLFGNNKTSKISLGLYASDGTELFYRETIQILNLVSILNSISLMVEGKEYFEDFQELEAIYSSEVEGYFTTRRELTKFINKEREPKTKDEKAVYSNYLALQYGLSNRDKLLSVCNNDIREFIFELNSIILNSVVTDYREEPVDIANRRGDVVHEGLPFLELNKYMDSLIEFTITSNLDPLINSCIIHFYFVYIHPFIDGNGRTARAYAYLYLICKVFCNYNLFSISYMLPERRKQYYNTLKGVEDNGYDLTEFIEVMLHIMIDGLGEIENKYKLINVVSNVKEIYKIYSLEYNVLTETLLTFLYNKESFNKDKFYKKIRSKFIRVGYTEEQLKKEVDTSIETLIQYNVIDKNYKINKTLTER